ncbi:hypothetical protein CV102_01750 [Natronococcus pandeyae]|uniref:DUF1102 domain-containing protein n=1 Tax=Natronococcus pandeyae TaxID=2055836 RepID=A0A8J8TRS5_9EURY|nr:DUF1102 domain-containing protein [Natronococcus pandeyae]TYL40326.1 hypothetical protein CV102_01750 [Natronococcus pandeyae]
MKRRTLIATVGGTLGGAGVVAGSGAFSFVRADRTVEAEVVVDKEAYLRLMPRDSNYVSHSTNGRLKFDFDDVFSEAGDFGEGVGSDSVYTFDDLFSARNQGTRDVSLYFEYDDDAVADIRVLEYPPSPSDDPLTADSPSSEIGPGEVVQFSVEIDTTDTPLGTYETSIELVAAEDTTESLPTDG